MYFEVTNKIDVMHYLQLLEKYQYYINFKHRTGHPIEPFTVQGLAYDYQILQNQICFVWM